MKEPRENCPWKCKYGDKKCLCYRAPDNSELIKEILRYKIALEKIIEVEPVDKPGFFRYKIPNRADCAVLASQALSAKEEGK